jgi:type I thyroxine 5'-deiodinase
VAFLVVYITEAHPSDVWQMQSNVRDKVVFASPKSEEERAFVAGACVRKLGIKYPAVLDEFGNSTETAYTGWPDRIYLIDQNGRVMYKSRPGPFGFSSEELSSSLKKVVGPPSVPPPSAVPSPTTPKTTWNTSVRNKPQA